MGRCLCAGSDGSTCRLEILWCARIHYNGRDPQTSSRRQLLGTTWMLKTVAGAEGKFYAVSCSVSIHTSGDIRNTVYVEVNT